MVPLESSEQPVAAVDAETMKQLSSLFRQRQQVYQKVARIHSAVKGMLLDLPQLKVYTRKLEAAYGEFSNFHSQIVALLPAEDLTSQEENYIRFEQLYDWTSASIEAQIIDHQHPPPHPQVIVHQQPLKAPFPTFDGEYTNWPKFKAMFQDLMAQSRDSDAIKLYHLDKALIGAAAGVLDAKTINDGNYAHAWRILTERFENHRIIVETHIRGLLSLKKMTSESYKELRNLLDECTKHVECLEYLQQELTGVSELVIVFLLTSALDPSTRKVWEQSLNSGELPKYRTTIAFLKGQCQVLERCESVCPIPIPKPSTTKQTQPKVLNQRTNGNRSVRQTVHPIAERMEKVRASGVCYNCLTKGHRSKDCPSTKNCQKCGKRHHTQLHEDQQQQQQPKPMATPTTQIDAPSQAAQQPTVSSMPCNYTASPKTVLLLTAVVHVLDNDNQPQTCRVLLDSGSQVNFITDQLASTLRLEKRKVEVPIGGINKIKTVARHLVKVHLQSRCSDFRTELECLVIPKVTGPIPSNNIDITDWDFLHGVQLADPNFFKPDKIDLLIGSALFFNILKTGHLILDPCLPELRESHLGWLVTGTLTSKSNYEPIQYAQLASVESIENSITRFWELEEVPTAPKTTAEEQQCEEHFVATHTRDVSADDPPQRGKYYLPHHAVLRPNSTTTKCRVVFDGSAKSSPSGLSLNNVLTVGPVVQNDLFSIMLRFRKHRYVLTADIAKMYRQVLQLTTVTYGTASAPFQATRCLIQLADDEGDKFPKAADILRHIMIAMLTISCDIMSGSDNIDEVIEIQRQLKAILLKVNEKQPTTKRIVCSEIAKLFDPLGLISPTIVTAKLLVQQLWRKKLDWDDHLDNDSLKHWNDLRESLSHLNEIAIPRQVTFNDAVAYELHGFADASMVAYGACVYIRSIFPDGSFLLWSDSQIVLAWIKKHPDRLEIFVRNRIAEINLHTQQEQWHYVPSQFNPADIVSRGLLPFPLSQNTTWWEGPQFLTEATFIEERLEDISDDELPELKVNLVTTLATNQKPLDVFTDVSCFRRLQRIIAWVLRYLNNRRKPKEERVLHPHLTIDELRNSMLVIVRVIQRLEFDDEIKRVQNGVPCKRLAALNPILSDGLLRVGGRLRHSNLPDESKHQLILPNNNSVTKLLVRALHLELLHVGPSGLISALRQRFWLLNARSTVRNVTRQCIKCFRVNPTNVQQLMGELPRQRVVFSSPFNITGVDYAGPIQVKQGKYRPKVVKAYVSVFVCMATKAIHLELVSDLTTDAFIAALERFISRRGMVAELHSDNATNFKGASNELHQLYQQFQDQQQASKIDRFCQSKEIGWHFIPPNAPEFGGLWEAAVKSTKYHLKRIIGTTLLSFEEMATLLCKIEAILNSRPLYSISNDPADPEVRKKNTSVQENIKPGMIVILHDNNRPPLEWKLGRITAVFPGDDNLVRAVDVFSEVW
ncbi:uncharacterized protein LOC129741136 [Uranotaenia lowii]|uniref:uncharacterized protein LOC129741136 n=1 Tax=Uranotaenia lowii TaxID=190385 RepID=UPI002478AB0D|nr:uncharacterized protein LOC129741136 [Uranotaenia lowii]